MASNIEISANELESFKKKYPEINIDNKTKVVNKGTMLIHKQNTRILIAAWLSIIMGFIILILLISLFIWMYILYTSFTGDVTPEQQDQFELMVFMGIATLVYLANYIWSLVEQIRIISWKSDDKLKATVSSFTTMCFISTILYLSTKLKGAKYTNVEFEHELQENRLEGVKHSFREMKKIYRKKGKITFLYQIIGKRTLLNNFSLAASWSMVWAGVFGIIFYLVAIIFEFVPGLGGSIFQQSELPFFMENEETILLAILIYSVTLIFINLMIIGGNVNNIYIKLFFGVINLPCLGLGLITIFTKSTAYDESLVRKKPKHQEIEKSVIDEDDLIYYEKY